MPDPTIAIAVVLLVAIVEASPAVRIPTGLLLAMALLAAGAELLPIALLGALGVMVARLSLALAARSGRERLRPSAQANAQRDALREHLARSPAYARTTFIMAALPGIPAGFVFPLLGAMRAPLGPALAGTIIGRIPVLALTTALFAWLGRFATAGDDAEAAVLLGVLAIMLFVFRTLGRIDWQHRAETGRWRLREVPDPFARVGVRLADSPNPWSEHPHRASVDDPDVVEGELLGEELVDDDEPGAGDRRGHSPDADDDASGS